MSYGYNLRFSQFLFGTLGKIWQICYLGPTLRIASPSQPHTFDLRHDTHLDTRSRALFDTRDTPVLSLWNFQRAQNLCNPLSRTNASKYPLRLLFSLWIVSTSPRPQACLPWTTFQALQGLARCHTSTPSRRFCQVHPVQHSIWAILGNILCKSDACKRIQMWRPHLWSLSTYLSRFRLYNILGNNLFRFAVSRHYCLHLNWFLFEFHQHFYYSSLAEMNFQLLSFWCHCDLVQVFRPFLRLSTTFLTLSADVVKEIGSRLIHWLILAIFDPH